MLEAFFSNSYAAIGAVLAACLAAHLAWRNGHKARTATACSAFRASVLKALTGLYPLPSNWPASGSAVDAALRAVFPELQTAVAEFRHFLPLWSRWRFDRAWRQYRNAYGRAVDVQVYHHYMGFNSPGEPVIDPKLTFHANVSHLLSFARET